MAVADIAVDNPYPDTPRPPNAPRASRIPSVFRVPRASPLPAMRHTARSRVPLARRGFTLIELLVVIAIIGLLAGLVVVGINAVAGSTENRSTATRMEALTTMLDNYRRNTAASTGAGATSTARELPRSLDGAIDEPIDPSNLDEQGGLSGGTIDPLYARTADVLDRLMNVPANKESLGALPANAKLNVDGRTLLLDGSNQLILFVPAVGVCGYGSGSSRTGITYDNFPAFETAANAASNAAAAPRLVARDGKAFFMSAGPDGNMATADDNVFSTDVVAVDSGGQLLPL